MKVLVACEFSGVVRDAFTKRGHDAISCDFLPSETLGVHHQGDVLEILDEGWDMMIAHPPCTYLCSSGLHWNKRIDGRQAKTEEALEFVRELLDSKIPRIALENPVGCISTQIRKYDQKVQPWQYGHDASKGTCLWLKNLPILSPTEIVPPAGWELVKYADDCPPCEMCGEPFCTDCGMHYADCKHPGPHQEDIATYKTIEGFEFATFDKGAKKPVWGNQTPSGQNSLPPSKDRWKLRSITYQGIAEAMASQWG